VEFPSVYLLCFHVQLNQSRTTPSDLRLNIIRFLRLSTDVP
jgi:hypothetical protein